MTPTRDDSLRAIGAEFLGSALLCAIVVGSGAAAQGLTDDVGLALLINALATVLGLGVLIVLFIIPFYAVIGVAFGTVDPILFRPIPSWNPVDWNVGWMSQTLTRLQPGGDLWNVLISGEERRRRAAEIFAWVLSGGLRVAIAARIPLAEGARAHRLLESRGVAGKIILLP